MKHVKLTHAEHVEIGGKLKEIRAELMTILLRVCKSEGTSSPVTKAADRATGSVDNLRSRLDSVLCASLPLSDDSWRGVYYGGKQPKDT